MDSNLPVTDSKKKSTCCATWWLLLAGLLGAMGVGIGAFEAHGLTKMLESQGLESEEVATRLHNCEVAVRYQLFHSLALLGLACSAQVYGGRSFQVAGVCWILGMLLFCGLLYVLVFTGNRSLVHLIPVGGVLLILGWIAVTVGAARAMGCCQRT